jgi:hypothetical protein
MAGIAVKVSWSGMTVRPAHGQVLQARFTDATDFETDSGEGALDGLIAGDYVCVSYKPRPGVVTARLVVFAPQPVPCGSGQHRDFLERSSSW